MTDDFEKSSVFGKSIRPIAKYQRNNILRRDIYTEIRKLNKTLHTGRENPQHIAIIEKFLDALIPSDDPGRLPIYADSPMAPNPQSALCVFYLVSCLIQSYWRYLKDEDMEEYDLTLIGLEILRDINRNYDKMKVAGNIKQGFTLRL